MTVEPRPQSRKRISIKEEVASINPLFLERQRSRYASRGIAFLVLLNGIAALLLMANLVRLRPQIENASEVASAMVVFGAGVAAALASMFFTYLRRTIRLEWPERIPSIPIGWWLAVVAAIVSAVCFVVGLNMVGNAMAPTLEKSATAAKSSVRGEESPQSVTAPPGAQGGKEAETQFATADEAKALLERAVVAVKEDKTKALDMFATGEGGFKYKDLYVWCANASDGILTVHPTNKGKELRDIKGKHDAPFGEVIMQNATEGTIKETTYWWPRPGSDKPFEKTTFYTKVGDQICGTGYYME